MPIDNPQVFPAAVDQIEAVKDGNVVYADEINKLGYSVTKIEQEAKTVVLTDRPAESNGSISARRSVVLDSQLVDAATNGKSYVDVELVLRDNTGNPLPGAPWTDPNYAIALDVVDRTYLPTKPKSLSSYDGTTRVHKPLNYSLLGYNGNKATIRLFSQSKGFNGAPVLLTTNPNGSRLYALCGDSESSMFVTEFASDGSFIKTIDLQNLPVDTPGFAVNLIRNGSFESDEDWSFYNGASRKGSGDEGCAARTGNKCVELDNWKHDGYESVKQLNVGPLTAGRTYILEFYYISPGSNGAQFQAIVQPQDASGNNVGSAIYLPGSGSFWKGAPRTTLYRRQQALFVCPTGATQCSVEIRCAPDVYWDNFRIDDVALYDAADTYTTTIDDVVRGFAADNSGNIYILYRPRATKGAAKLYKFSSSGTITTINADAYSMWNASGIAVDSAGNIFVARSAGPKWSTKPLNEEGTYRDGWITKIDPKGKHLGDFSYGKDGDNGWYSGSFKYRLMQALAISPKDGHIYAGTITNYYSGGWTSRPVLLKLDTALNSHDDASTGTYLGAYPNGTWTSGMIGFNQMAIAPSGRIYWIDRMEVPYSELPEITEYERNRPYADKATQWAIRSIAWEGGTAKASQITTVTHDPTGKEFGPDNIPTGIAVTSDGRVWITSSGNPDAVLSYGNVSIVVDGTSYKYNAIGPYEQRVRAGIFTTVVNWADPTWHLKISNTGNLAPNPSFNNPVKLPYITGAGRVPSLLRDKPSPAVGGSVAYGWGALRTTNGSELWKDAAAADLISNMTTDMFVEDTSSGRRIVTTCAACVTTESENVAFVQPPTDQCLYIPAAWLGNSPGADLLHDTLDILCSADAKIDKTPVYQAANASVEGCLAVPVIDIKMPRTAVAGDRLTVAFNWQSHLLDTIQNADYDIRTLGAFMFTMFLDTSGSPIQLTGTYSDGKPLYRHDVNLGRLSTTQQNPASRKSSIIKASTHSYILSSAGLVKHKSYFNVPAAAATVRIGFTTAAWSATRADNILTDTGESGGLFIRDLTVALTNPTSS